ncbi:MAG TPA: hypothetical protein VG294_06075 [Solirubrobacteraceae bacterium]|jgi:hypothetical protein|nr:hypothetical protein [Solirubrobacteraceae bacterium]
MSALPDIDLETAVGRWAVDELLERYVSWREECQAVRAAYRRLPGAGGTERTLTYAGYLAALEREEHAAQAYADHIEHVRRGIPSEVSGSSRAALR